MYIYRNGAPRVFPAADRAPPIIAIMLVSGATDVAFWDPARSQEPTHLVTQHAAPVTSLRWTSNDRVLGLSLIHISEPTRPY